MSAAIKNADIPRVGAGTPGGTWLRRYWLPVSRSDEIFDIPKSVKVLGEELVLFRAESGELGLVGQDCPHRGRHWNTPMWRQMEYVVPIMGGCLMLTEIVWSSLRS